MQHMAHTYQPLPLCWQVDGQDLQQCYKGRWDDLFDKTNTCLKKIIPIAAAKLRNYILDQVGRPRRLCHITWIHCFSVACVIFMLTYYILQVQITSLWYTTCRKLMWDVSRYKFVRPNKIPCNFFSYVIKTVMSWGLFVSTWIKARFTRISWIID